MSVFRPFEIEAIRLMAEGALSNRQWQSICEAENAVSYEYTGSGYFLTVGHRSLPVEKRTLTEPAVVGSVGGIQAGFVTFLGDRKLTLECHTWGSIDIPEDFRDQVVLISTPPIKIIDHGCAT